MLRSKVQQKINLKVAKVFFNYLIFLAKSLALSHAFSTFGPLNQSPQIPKLIFLVEGKGKLLLMI